MARRFKFATGAIALIGVVVIASVSVARSPRLVWNATASAPVGLYRVQPAHALLVGDLVLVKTPSQIAFMAAARGYLPLHVPLVKRIAAMAGDRVCMKGGTLFINATAVARPLARDGQGRPLSPWHGCRRLHRGEVFLLMRGVSASFDSRYFGPVPAASVIGILRPLWTP